MTARLRGVSGRRVLILVGAVVFACSVFLIIRRPAPPAELPVFSEPVQTDFGLQYIRNRDFLQDGSHSWILDDPSLNLLVLVLDTGKDTLETLFLGVKQSHAYFGDECHVTVRRMANKIMIFRCNELTYCGDLKNGECARLYGLAKANAPESFRCFLIAEGVVPPEDAIWGER